MTNHVLIINDKHIENAIEILQKHRIRFRLEIPPTVDVIVKKYESKINKKTSSSVQKEHRDMNKYAKQLGCNSTGEAIQKVGSANKFRYKFKTEFIG